MLQTMPLPAWAKPFFDGPDSPGCGIVQRLPAEQYHNTKALISKSMLDVAARSLSKFHHALTQPLTEKDSDALRIGSMFHVMVLEPHLFHDQFTMLPSNWPTSRSNADKAYRAQWHLDNRADGKYHYTQAEYAMLEGMADSLRRHPRVAKLMAHGQAEVTAVATHHRTGLRVKGRADFKSDVLPVCLDLKSALDASISGFRKAIGERRYYVQDPFYSWLFRTCGEDVDHFVFPVVEKESPYDCVVYELDPATRMAGEAIFERQLTQIREANDKGLFPFLGNDILPIAAPDYILAKAEAMGDDLEPEFPPLQYTTHTRLTRTRST